MNDRDPVVHIKLSFDGINYDLARQFPRELFQDDRNFKTMFVLTQVMKDLLVIIAKDLDNGPKTSSESMPSPSPRTS